MAVCVQHHDVLSKLGEAAGGEQGFEASLTSSFQVGLTLVATVRRLEVIVLTASEKRTLDRSDEVACLLTRTVCSSCRAPRG